MASNVLIGNFASGLWLNLGSLSALSALTISGFVVQPSTLGSLNNRLGTSFSGTGLLGTGVTFDTVPDITNRELAIVEGLFLVSWYNQLASASMGLGGSSIPWVSLKEADESITRERPANLGAEYRTMAKEARLYMEYLVGAYVDGDRGTSFSVDYLNPAYPYLAANAYNTTQRSLPGPSM